jgi:recombination protein RecA
MTKNKKEKKDNTIATSDDFSAELIKELNKEAGSLIAFNLGTDEAPTNIKRWISTGSRQLDCILSNKAVGGLPEGRIVEIQGPTSCGKSHLAYGVAKHTQKMGGIVVYIDTENATNLNNLKMIGLDVNNRFVFVQTNCTENIFAVAESAIHKARALTKDIPVTIIWDSVAASSPKAELEGDYDQSSIGLQARALGKGFRKIVNIIGNQNVLFLLINQQRKNIGVMFGDDTVVPGGMAIPYASSIRIRLMTAKKIEKNGEPIGVQVEARTIKNKVATPFRKCTFSIYFGIGITEHEEVFDLFREYCDKSKKGVEMPNGEYVLISGKSQWKNFIVTNSNGEPIHEVKFHKADFAKKVLDKPEYTEYIEALYEATLVLKKGKDNKDNPTLSEPNQDSLMEVAAVAMETKENGK